MITDCKSSLLYVEINLYNSSILMAFGMIFGRYHYVQMSLGASPSSDILQATLDQIFTVEKFPFKCNITDNFVVIGDKEGGSDHDDNL